MGETSNIYRQNGLKLQYFFGARNYDAAIARWFNLDPLAEKTMQPYSAFNNNPVMFTDPTVMSAEDCPDCPKSSFGLGLSYGTEGFKANFNYTLDQKNGDFTSSYGLGVTYHSNLSTTGKNGFEFRNSFMLNYNDGSTSTSLGTNLWSGSGKLSEFSQRTGVFSLSSGKFNFSYENNGTPFQYFGLGDNGDSYRTAAASIGMGNVSLNVNLFTGLRNEQSFNSERLQDKLEGVKGGSPMSIGKYGENYKHGFVIEQGTQYRYGGLTLNFAGASAGVNSEWVRHAFQNEFAHDFFQPQRQFPMLSNDWKTVINSSNAVTSKFTTWGR